MRTGKALVVGLAVCVAMVGVAFAAVIVDENGIGFVGKGDVQSVFDWNNSDLQANAEFLRFRMGSGSQGASWTCSKVNSQGKIQTQVRSCTRIIDATMAFDSRKNKEGQITGFNLNGFGTQGNQGDWICLDDEGEACGYGTCPTKWTLEGGVIINDPIIGTDDILQVSIDGEIWFELPITQ